MDEGLRNKDGEGERAREVIIGTLGEEAREKRKRNFSDL